MNELGLLPGMSVRSADGERLGRVKHVRPDGTIEVGRRLFAPHECLIRYSDVSAVKGDYVVLKVTADQLRESGSIASFDMGAEAIDEDRGVPSGDDPIIPYHIRLRETGWSEEDARASQAPHIERREVPNGEVRIHKTVVQEPMRMSMPVMIETVRVEQLPAPDGGLVDPDPQSAFVEETITVPVRRQELELTKRPVLREEIRVAVEEHEDELELLPWEPEPAPH
ncbi:MAG: DUF2382 domain-containing protein [Myxococcaceae bacterium]